ncbi:hypothetical protein J6590_031833, partial [Homalodisca vitripennis]
MRRRVRDKLGLFSCQPGVAGSWSQCCYQHNSFVWPLKSVAARRSLCRPTNQTESFEWMIKIPYTGNSFHICGSFRPRPCKPAPLAMSRSFLPASAPCYTLRHCLYSHMLINTLCCPTVDIWRALGHTRVIRNAQQLWGLMFPCIQCNFGDHVMDVRREMECSCRKLSATVPRLMCYLRSPAREPSPLQVLPPRIDMSASGRFRELPSHP